MKIEPIIKVTVDPETFDKSIGRFNHGGMMTPVASNCPLSLELTKRFGVEVAMGFNRFNVYPREGASRLTYAAVDTDGADACRTFTHSFNGLICNPQTMPENIEKFRSQLPKTFTFKLETCKL